MANVIAKARGYRKSGAPRQQNEVTALGDASVHVEGNTWQTFANIDMKADGSGTFTITRNGKTYRILWNTEANALMVDGVTIV